MLNIIKNIFKGKEHKAYSNYGASVHRKSLQSFIPSGRDVDTDLTRNLNTLRARSRDLYMGSPLATGAIKTLRTNIVGSGLMLSPHIDRKFLNLSEDKAKEWEAQVKREWAIWSSSYNCDATRRLNFYQIQSLAFMSAVLSGDCFVALPFIKRKESPYNLKIYLIESDRVCDPLNCDSTKDILEGVELGEYGEPIAFYISRYHPLSTQWVSNMQQQWYRVPAYGAKTGRQNIIHLMADFERPGQRRGIPVLANVVEALKQLSRFTDAELTAAVVSSMFTGFIKTQDGAGLNGIFDKIDEHEKDTLAMGNGTLVNLKPGEDITFGDPSRPNVNFGGFVEAVCRQIGAALEIPYELLIKNFTASYSASRASLLEAWKMFRMRRQWLTDGFCQPIYKEWLTEAVALGRIDAPGFFDDIAIKEAWCCAEWAGDAQGQLDPLKEANAAVVRINNGLSTREKEAAELTGLSFDLISEQLQRENKLMPLSTESTLASQNSKLNDEDEKE